jgi:hypothetical protein
MFPLFKVVQRGEARACKLFCGSRQHGCHLHGHRWLLVAFHASSSSWSSIVWEIYTVYEIETFLALDPRLVSKLEVPIAAGINSGPSDRFPFAMAYMTFLTIKVEDSGGVSYIARLFGTLVIQFVDL